MSEVQLMMLKEGQFLTTIDSMLTYSYYRSHIPHQTLRKDGGVNGEEK